MTYIPLKISDKQRIENIESAFFYSLIGIMLYSMTLRLIERGFSLGNNWILILALFFMLIMVIFVGMAIGYITVVSTVALDRLVLYWIKKIPKIKIFFGYIGGNMRRIIKILLWLIFVICLILFKKQIGNNVWAVITIFFSLTIATIRKN